MEDTWMKGMPKSSVSFCVMNSLITVISSEEWSVSDRDFTFSGIYSPSEEKQASIASKDSSYGFSIMSI